MLQTKPRTIGDTTYHVRQLGASKGRAMLVRLTRVLGPVLGALLEGNVARPPGSGLPPKVAGTPEDKAKAKARLGAILDADPTTVSNALRELASRLTVEDLEYVVSEFGTCTQITVDNGDKGIGLVPLNKERQELHFAGKYGEMFRWIGFCLEVNYRDFFSASGLAEAQDNGPEAEGPSL